MTKKRPQKSDHIRIDEDYHDAVGEFFKKDGNATMVEFIHKLLDAVPGFTAARLRHRKRLETIPGDDGCVVDFSLKRKPGRQKE